MTGIYLSIDEVDNKPRALIFELDDRVVLAEFDYKTRTYKEYPKILAKKYYYSIEDNQNCLLKITPTNSLLKYLYKADATPKYDIYKFDFQTGIWNIDNTETQLPAEEEQAYLEKMKTPFPSDQGLIQACKDENIKQQEEYQARIAKELAKKAEKEAEIAKEQARSAKRQAEKDGKIKPLVDALIEKIINDLNLSINLEEIQASEDKKGRIANAQAFISQESQKIEQMLKKFGFEEIIDGLIYNHCKNYKTYAVDKIQAHFHSLEDRLGEIDQANDPEYQSQLKAQAAKEQAKEQAEKNGEIQTLINKIVEDIIADINSLINIEDINKSDNKIELIEKALAVLAKQKLQIYQNIAQKNFDTIVDGLKNFKKIKYKNSAVAELEKYIDSLAAKLTSQKTSEEIIKKFELQAIKHLNKESEIIEKSLMQDLISTELSLFPEKLADAKHKIDEVYTGQKGVFTVVFAELGEKSASMDLAFKNLQDQANLSKKKLDTVASQAQEERSKAEQEFPYYKIVLEAQRKYSAWYAALMASDLKEAKKFRGDCGSFHGFFTKRRHGPDGQDAALDLVEELKNQNDSDAKLTVATHLTLASTKYNRHSFASFILDELKNSKFDFLNLRDEKNLRPNAKAKADLYSKSEICSRISKLEIIGTSLKSGSSPS